MLRSTKSKFFFYFSLLSAILLTGGIADGVSTWVNNENAVTVLGQPNFLSATAASGPSAMFQPSAVRFDPISGKVFVADCANNRVLRFTSAQALISGGAAEAAFGQIDLNATSGGFSQSRIRCVGEMAIDAVGHLWIADIDNSRVLRWDSAATISSGQPANAVLGQPDFATVTAGTTPSKMSLPEGLFVDDAGRLWVADTGNNRVLRFDGAAAKPNGANADAVLGQLDFVSSSAAMTQTNLAAPNSITGNLAGSIWVSDSGNDRVLRFDAAASKGNGAGADGILGSTSFTTLTSTGTTRTSMDAPTGLTVDPLDRLYVADGANDRVLIFNGASSIVDGSGATNVLGQPNFSDATARLSQSGFDMPYTPAWDETSQSLWTADLANNRVMRFTPQVATSGNVSLSGQVLNGSGRGIRNAHVSFTDSTGEIRTTVTNAFGYYAFGDVESGSTLIMNASARGYTFESRVVQAFDSLTDVNFSPR